MSTTPTPPNRRKTIVTLIVLAIFGVGGLFWVVAGNLLTTDLTRRLGLGQPKLDCKQQADQAKKDLKKDYGIDIELVTTLGDSFEVCDVTKGAGETKDKLVLTVKSKVNNEATKLIGASIENLKGEIIEKRSLVTIDDSDACVAWKRDQKYKLKVNYRRGDTRVIRFSEKSCEQ